MLCLCPAGFSKLRQPTGQRHSNVKMQQNIISIRIILFLYYYDSLVSSKSNSKLFRFHFVRPKLYIVVHKYVSRLRVRIFLGFNVMYSAYIVEHDKHTWSLRESRLNQSLQLGGPTFLLFQTRESSINDV